MFRHSENHKNQPLQARKTIKICLFHHRFLTCFEFASSIIASGLGQFEDAKELYRIALEKWEALGDRREISSIYNNLGVVYTIEGNFKEARHALEHALSIRQELGDIVRIGSTLAGLGDLDELEGDWAGAEKYYTECLEAARLVGDKRNMGLSLLDLARIAQKQNNLQQANQLASVARRVLLSIGAVKGIAESDEIIRQTQTVMTNVNIMKDTV